MERTWTLDDGDQTTTITAICHGEWQDMADPCPECGSRVFRHVSTAGGRYELVDDVPTRRAEYWDAEQVLFTQCLDCNAILYKHPAFDLLFDSNDDE